MIPHVIQIYTPTVVIHEANQKKKSITPERLMEIACGVVAAVFGIIGFVFMFLRKRNASYYYSDDLTDSSFENETNTNTNTKTTQNTRETEINTEIIDSKTISVNQNDIDLDWI